MTKSDVASPSSWGTWEELLLAFAVNRHGDGAWDSIASELQRRTSDPNLTLTAKTCRLKYLDLKRRFVSSNDDDSEDTGRRGDKSNAEETVPLLEELRKLRVAELRREVERYDLNIESLELKMKRMEEEREKASRRENTESDLEKNSEETRDTKPPAAEEQLETAGDESEKDQLSVNESNSTDPEAEKLRTGEKESEPVGTGGDFAVRQDQTGQSSEEPDELRSEPDRKSVRSDSCNGSSNSIEKEEEIKDEPAVGLAESDAESDGGETAASKENSDVQSSASRSRKEEGSDKVRRMSTSGDECEHEDQSRTVKRSSVQSQPLLDFLQSIKSHKLGSVFERRLRSQESSKYHKTILQHLDFETIETRLKEGCYSNSTTKFFRDLLLLVTNALVFFAKNSSEANAATEIRRLILKEMSQKHTKSDSSSGKQISLNSLSTFKKDEPEPLILKPRIPGSLIVCRKRSSIAAKADKKKEQIEEEEKDPEIVEEPKITKKRTRDRFPSAPANSKKNVKKAPVVEPVKTTGKGSEPKNENKKNQSSLDSKKRGAANFLNRMKQGGSSSSNNGGLLDALKNTPLTSESSSGKKNESGKKKETGSNNNITRRSAETRQSKEKGSPGKKNIGRPPKRGAAAPSPPPPVLGKRGRRETETPPSKQQPKKRTRKL